MSHRSRHSRKPWWRKHLGRLILFCLSISFIILGVAALWFSSLKIPDLSVFEARKVAESTKIYDRTGKILLYDVHSDAKRTIIAFENISQDIKNATIAIEDTEFYFHKGIKPTAILRAVLADIAGGGLSQGGSTITQQVIKNSVLTTDKTITRKIKEWVLALKLEKVFSKDQILSIYLNESPYGGNLYGVEEASKTFFGKSAHDVTLAEAAYLAAIPQAPTFYSPYGKNLERLEVRQKLVLSKMRESGFIDEKQHEEALSEKVSFLEKNTVGIRAPHFSLYVRDYLIEKYGQDAVDKGGLTVITSLNYEMQEKAEKVIRKFSPSLESQFNASNTALVAIDPKSGDILTMVGSKDYFNKEIDGNFNVATAYRQPGSTFKPFVYATAFMKGYTPETVLFDVKTEFSTQCTPEGLPKPGVDLKTCYSPLEYDNIYEGPVTIRHALAHSRNIPAVKALYLAGIKDSISTAEAMGITSLRDPDRYGLTLVLGGGEVSLLELTSAYGVFANDGVRNKYRSILKVEDSTGKVLEEARNDPNQSIPPQIARQVSDILSDPKARLSYLNPLIDALGGKQVAMKTGTTNDYRDVWIVGYTPGIVVGAWAGKNDNTPMDKKVAGLIIAPVWGAFLAEINSSIQREYFKKPESISQDIKPPLRGIWKGGLSYKIDTLSKKLATEYTPPELTEETILNGVHSILHWVKKEDPHGEIPQNPQNDSQYDYWELGVRKWFDEWKKTHPEFVETTYITIPTEKDDIHVPDNFPIISISSPLAGSVLKIGSKVSVFYSTMNKFPLKKIELYINDKLISTSEQSQINFNFYPKELGLAIGQNIIRVVAHDSMFNRGEASVDITLEE